MQWTKSLLNLLYPNRCPVCGTFIGAQVLLCDTCADSVVLAQDAYCHSCGKTTCLCSRSEFAYDAAVVCAVYQNVTPAIIALKQSANTNFAFYAAQILAERLRTDNYPRPDCVMPVPMHRSKQLRRGYNQAALIGRKLAELLALPYREDVLTKERTATEQHTLSAAERANNTDSFGIQDCDLQGQRILLCDDVLTTGNTMHRCAALLKERGAAAVIAAAAASTAPKQKENAVSKEDTT